MSTEDQIARETILMEVFESIRKRRSIRSYKDEPVSDDVVADVLESARMAPSAVNRQEWAFVVVRNKGTKRKILEAAFEIETTLTQPAWKRLQVGGAPLEAMTRTISKTTGKNITPDNIRSQGNLPDLLEQYTRQGITAMFGADVLIAVYRKFPEEIAVTIPNSYDVGAAVQNMLLTATSHGLGSLWAGGFSRRDTKIEWRASGPGVSAFYKDRISEILHAPKEMDLAALVFIGKAASEPAPPPRKKLKEIAFLDEFGKPWKKTSA